MVVSVLIMRYQALLEMLVFMPLVMMYRLLSENCSIFKVIEVYISDDVVSVNCQVTPQQALMQTMAAMHQKVTSYLLLTYSHHCASDYLNFFNFRAIYID